MPIPSQTPPLEYLWERFSYNPETGALSWKIRDPSEFRTARRRNAWLKKAGRHVGTKQGPYLSIYIKCHRVAVHRICFSMGNSVVVPKGVHVDHKDRNTLNNRLDNLRLASAAQNGWNAKSHRNRKRNLPKNVTLYVPTGRYCAAFRANKKLIYLGYFETPDEAAIALSEARKIHHGEYARDE